MSRPRRAPSSTVTLLMASTLALGSGCQATGGVANDYFDWGGRTFTTNPGSVAPYFLGFGAFFIAGLPLDLFSWIATAIGWSEGAGAEDYQGCALAPSILLGTSGGILLGAPFFPLGLPWWNSDEASSRPADKKPATTSPSGAPSSESPTSPTSPTTPPATNPPAGAPSSESSTSQTVPPDTTPVDTTPPAGAPGRPR